MPDNWVTATFTQGYTLQFRFRAPCLWLGPDDCHPRPNQGLCPWPGVVSPPGQECHRTGGSSTAGRGLLFHLFPGAKEGRGVMPSTRSVGTQPVSDDLAFSHFNDSRGAASDGPRGVVHAGRPQGCILSCTYSSPSPAVLEVRLPGTALLPFGLFLSPSVFTRCVAAALALLQTGGLKVCSATSTHSLLGPVGEYQEELPGTLPAVCPTVR